MVNIRIFLTRTSSADKDGGSNASSFTLDYEDENSDPVEDFTLEKLLFDVAHAMTEKRLIDVS